MSQTAWIVVAVVVVAAVLVIAAIMSSRRRRSEHLKDRFGREHDRTVKATGDRSKAEADLEEREKRVEKLDIRPLDASERLGDEMRELVASGKIVGRIEPW